MTNKEYIEKNNISFSDAMKMYDNEKYPCINDWLNQEHQEHKFKIGDFVINISNRNYIGVVIDVKDYVYLKWLNRDGTLYKWVTSVRCDKKYYRNNHEVFCMDDETKYEKIF